MNAGTDETGRTGGPRADADGWVELTTADDTRAYGQRLGERLSAGDVVLLTGELGAGKTTLTQGLAEGLGVRGPITSPTFVISRIHPSLGDGPALVHVDAYRLGDAAELEDIGLDDTVRDAVTVVEWGRGLAEQLGDSYLEVEIARPVGAQDVPTDAGPVAAGSDAQAAPDGGADAAVQAVQDSPDADVRRIRLVGHGPRWASGALD